jgi:hypothetical protein
MTSIEKNRQYRERQKKRKALEQQSPQLDQQNNSISQTPAQIYQQNNSVAKTNPIGNCVFRNALQKLNNTTDVAADIDAEDVIDNNSEREFLITNGLDPNLTSELNDFLMECGPATTIHETNIHNVRPPPPKRKRDQSNRVQISEPARVRSTRVEQYWDIVKDHVSMASMFV